MKLALMQPYLFPYLGYFQLIAAVDKFVFYDDVNYIKNGWINRNRVLLNGEIRYITVPLAGASPFLKINEVMMQAPEFWVKKLLESIRHGYSKAPHYPRVSELLGDVLGTRTDRIGTLAARSVTEVARYLGLDTEFVQSSVPYRNAELSGVPRVLDICARERADIYVNLPGGRTLYEEQDFAAAGIELVFVEPDLRPYDQANAAFHPGLSILDVLMFNSAAEVKAMLAERVSS
jgi:WbqC-like protein family